MTADKTPATLATAKHGGCVQLGDALHEAVGRVFGCDGSPWRTRDVAAVLRDYAALAARQPVGESQMHWGWLVDGVPFKGSSTCDMSAVPLYAGEPDPPLVVRVPRHEAAPYFECKPEQWEQHTHGMTTAGKNVLANMLAHHCLLARRDDLGWIITRYDLIAGGRPWWHVSNNGKLTYDYDPATKARMVAALPAQAVDLGKLLPAVRMLVVSARTSGGTAGHDAHLCEALDRVEALLPNVDSQAVGNG